MSPFEIKSIFVESLGWRNGVSLGVHVCKWRVDIHVGSLVLSIGVVPTLLLPDGRRIAVSNSYYEANKHRHPIYYLRIRK